MPKLIQPRRHDKALTAQQFWDIRNQQKSLKQHTPQAYREEEVNLRHRFQKPSEKAKTFNPLSYFLKPKQLNLHDDLEKMVDQEEGTFVGEYLKSVQGRVSPQLEQIKKLALGKKSVIHNQQKIYRILWTHLQLEDSWHLLQAVIRDTHQESNVLWLKEGFQSMGRIVDSLAGKAFRQQLFNNLFETLCVLMETSFNTFMTDFQQFFLRFATSFLKHSNKYIRKFSLQVFSYIFANINQEQYSSFISYLAQLSSENFFDKLLSLAGLLVQRLTVVRGCLTAASLGILVEQLESFSNVVRDQSLLQETISQYVFLVLSQLSNRGGGSSETIIFDFNYILEVFIGLRQKCSAIYNSALIIGFSKFISLYNSDQKRFEPHNGRQAAFMGRMWDKFSVFFRENALSFKADEVLHSALAVVSTSSRQSLFSHKQVIEYYQNNPAAVEALVNHVYNYSSDVGTQFTEIVLMLSKGILINFFQNDSSYQLVYKIILILKRSGISHSIESSWLGLTSTIIQNSINKASSQQNLILTLRLLTFINFSPDQSLIKLLYQAQRTSLQVYQTYLISLMKHPGQRLQIESMSKQMLYDWTNFTREIIVFSHHQISWLRQAFNLYETFFLLFRHIETISNSALPFANSLWNQLLVSRCSTALFLQKTHSCTSPLLHTLIGSRNREARHHALKILKSQNKRADQQTVSIENEILELLIEIDGEDINLDNEREVKKNLHKLKQLSKVFRETELEQSTVTFFEYLIQWAMGFAFTGFKLIQQSFIAFFSYIISVPIVSAASGKTIVVQKLIPFLCYYNYRHSRQYDFDISSSASQTHLVQKFQIPENSLSSFMSEDFNLREQETVQWIGLQRIAESIKVSQKGKTILGEHLLILIEGYFSIQFKRQQSLIRQYSEDHERNQQPQSALLLPIKNRFLQVILKLCPQEYLPPFECLHFVTEPFFQLKRVRQIKRHFWEKLWQKAKESTKKTENNERIKDSVNLAQLSAQESQMYLHYLWKLMLQSNHHRVRAILEHIRNQLAEGSFHIFNIFLESLCLDEEIWKKQSILQTITRRIVLINRKVLLAHMFILKSMLANLRKELTEGSEVVLSKIFTLLLALIELVYSSSPKQSLAEGKQLVQLQQQQQQQQQNIQQQAHQIHKEGDDEESLHSNDEGDEEAEPGSQSFLYKPHRKQLQKLFTTLFTYHELNQENISQLLQALLNRIHINIKKSTRSSVPGLLNVLSILSQQKVNCLLLITTNDGQIIEMLSSMIALDENGNRPSSQCCTLWINIMSHILLQSNSELQEQAVELVQQKIDALIQPLASGLLESILSYLQFKQKQQQTGDTGLKTPKNKKTKKQEKAQEQIQILCIVEKLISLNGVQLQGRWGEYVGDQLQKITKIKLKLTPFHYRKLSLLIKILSSFLKLSRIQDTTIFLKRIILLLPHLKDSEQRLQIIKSIGSANNAMGLSDAIVDLTSKMGEVNRVGLIVTINFTSFFEACNRYIQLAGSLSTIEHEFFLFCLLCYSNHEELSVRRMVSQCLKTFSEHASSHLVTSQASEESKKSYVEITMRLYRTLLDLLQKHQIIQNQSIFWSVVDNAEMITTWIANNAEHLLNMVPQSTIACYQWICGNNQEQYLKLLPSLSQANKLRALKYLKHVLQTVPAEVKHNLKEWNQQGFDLPNPLFKLLLPILYYFILRPVDPNQPKSNLGSSLALSSLQILPHLSPLLKPNILKKQIKKLLSKIKLSQTHSKINIAVIKTVGQLLEGLEGETTSSLIRFYIEEHGFEKFHQKARASARRKDPESSESEEEEGPKKEKLPDFFERLDQLDEEEAIRRNFMSFDKKLVEMEEEEPEETDFSYFLKRQILPLLRTLLMTQSRSSEEDDASKAKILLSVTTVKVLLHLPLDIFLSQFSKIVSKLARLLKRREERVREEARKCLCQIAKTVGPQLLYSIINTLNFNLKDNFDRHVFNYTVYRLLEGLTLTPGDLNYCLPLLLPMIMDEIYGRASLQKELVSRGEAPTLKGEAKKKKGLQLLQLLCKNISHTQINYLIDFLQKYLRENLVSEENLGKYEQMLGTLGIGLSNNLEVTDSNNSPSLLSALYKPITSLRQHLKWIQSFEKPLHQSMLSVQGSHRKTSKNETFTLQEEAGRNGSIFKRLKNEVSEQRNKEIVTSALVQFYLTVLSMLVKKHVFTAASTLSNPTEGQHLTELLAFLVDCISHRDNRLVTKSLKILHIAFGWKIDLLPEQLKSAADKIKSLKRQASRKVLALAQKLTLADEELLRQCFVFLNDLVTEASVTIQSLPSLVAIIKLHTPTTDEQPHLPETYKLLKTILYKCPTYIYHHLLEDVHQMVKLQLVTCRNREIKDLSKAILSVYIRGRETLEPSIQAHNRSLKKHGASKARPLDYDSLMKDEIAFYVSNLDSPAQLTILELITEFVGHRQAQELQKYAQFIILSLMTSRTNSLLEERQLTSEEAEHPFDKIIKEILSRVNQSKVSGLVEKCMLWIKSPRMSSIRLCGCSLLRIILLDESGSKVASKYMKEEGGWLQLLEVVLSEEVERCEWEQGLQKGHGKLDSQWNQIVHGMDKKTPEQQYDPSVTESLSILNALSTPSLLWREGLYFEKKLLAIVWKLLKHQKPLVMRLSLQICQHQKILPMLKSKLLPCLEGQRQQETDKDPSTLTERYSPSKIVAHLLFQPIQTELIQQLIIQLLVEEHQLYRESELLKTFCQLLFGLSLKAHIKPKVYEQTLPKLLLLLNGILTKDLQGSTYNCREVIVGDDNLRGKLIEMSLKLLGNQLISHESKALAQETAQILKEELGTEQYYKCVNEFEERRRSNREKERVRKAELAVLDPEAVGAEKRAKKRKLQ